MRRCDRAFSFPEHAVPAIQTHRRAFQLFDAEIFLVEIYNFNAVYISGFNEAKEIYIPFLTPPCTPLISYFNLNHMCAFDTHTAFTLYL